MTFLKTHLKDKGWLFQVNLKNKNSEYLHLNEPKMEMIRQRKKDGNNLITQDQCPSKMGYFVE